MSIYTLEIPAHPQGLLHGVHLCTKHARNPLRDYLARPESDIIQDESDAIHTFTDTLVARHYKNMGTAGAV